MVQIKLTNTKTRQKEVFEPLDPQNVRMYVCGPTVYDRAHLGNARPVVVFDVLYRLLRHVYGAEHVTYVRNFTDVDDKINATALARKNAGAKGTIEELVAERSDETIGWYLKDMGMLGALEPNHMPRATAYIPQMVAMIETLIADGHAYEAEGHVLFAVDSWTDSYGKLSGRSVDDMIAGARVEVAAYKKNPREGGLWRHIECSAMAKELLGVKFDIHGGGNDLMFPHHENEIAQSCCANHTDEMAQFWLHNEMLQVEGKKMSKSLGNFFTVRDLLDQGVPGEVIRFVFLSTHYRKPMDWTEKKAKEAEATLRKWYAQAIQGVGTGEPHPEIVSTLADDLNTAGAITQLHALSAAGDIPTLRYSLQFLGFMDDEAPQWAVPKSFDFMDYVSTLKDLRKVAMETKDFTALDAYKAALNAAGVEVRMTKETVDLVPGPGFDPAKLEGV